MSAVTRDVADGRRVTRVLDGLTLAVAAGDAVVVSGGAGAGKSLLVALAGALELPTLGHVLIDGTDPQRLAAADRARLRGRDVGFVFTEPSLVADLTVLDNVLLPTEAGEAVGEATDRARALLGAVGLEPRLDARASSLSPAEAQRAALARAFLRSPRVVLCDDPTQQLSHADADGFIDRLLRLHARHHAALLVTTRDASPFAGIASHLALRNGRLEPRPQ